MLKDAKSLAAQKGWSLSELSREALGYYMASLTEQRERDDLQWVRQIVREAQTHALTPKELAAEDKRLKEYGASQARALGTQERDVAGIVRQARIRSGSS